MQIIIVPAAIVIEVKIKNYVSKKDTNYRRYRVLVAPAGILNVIADTMEGDSSEGGAAKLFNLVSQINDSLLRNEYSYRSWYWPY